MTKGIRIINGREYLLSGRAGSKESAESEATAIRRRGKLVRIIRLRESDYLIYSH